MWKTLLLNRLKRIGTSTRDNLYGKSDVPGPGTYSDTLGNYSGPKYGFGSSKRDRNPLHEMSKTLPGPGAYDSKSYLDNHGTTLISRRPDSASKNTYQKAPGPGAYEPKIIPKANAPSYKMGTAGRSGLVLGSKVPGPGEYNPKIFDSAPKYG